MPSEDQVKKIATLLFVVTSWALLLVAMATEFWIDLNSASASGHTGLFYEKGSFPYSAAYQTCQAFYLITIFILLIAFILKLLDMIGQCTDKIPDAVKNIGDKLIHLSSLLLFIADIVFTQVIGGNGYSFRCAWASFCFCFLASCLLAEEMSVTIKCGGGDSKSSSSVAVA